MKLADFDYQVPQELIAQYPVYPRDAARLIVVHRATKTIEHRKFSDILEYFSEGDLLVLNNSKVFPARLFGSKEKTGAPIEVLMLRELNNESRLWDVVVDPARKIRVGNKLYFGDNDLVAEVVDNTTARGRTIRFLFDGDDEEFYALVQTLGETPLPPYITRPVEENDNDYYQTVYAQERGSVSVIDAGLQFTRETLKLLELQGVEHQFVTLHTGLGSLKEVEVEDFSKHKMDSEYYFISPQTAEEVNKAKMARKKVCAVGPSVVRVLESSVSARRLLNAGKGWTDRFIYPYHQFAIPDALLSNLLPSNSSVVMLVSAFCDHDLLMKAYKEAIEQKYRFYCYGDAMLIL